VIQPDRLGKGGARRLGGKGGREKLLGYAKISTENSPRSTKTRMTLQKGKVSTFGKNVPGDHVEKIEKRLRKNDHTPHALVGSRGQKKDKREKKKGPPTADKLAGQGRGGDRAETDSPPAGGVRDGEKKDGNEE